MMVDPWLVANGGHSPINSVDLDEGIGVASLWMVMGLIGG